MVEFAYNNKVHTGTKVLPFQANSGQDPRMGFGLRKKERLKGAKSIINRLSALSSFLFFFSFKYLFYL